MKSIALLLTCVVTGAIPSVARANCGGGGLGGGGHFGGRSFGGGRYGTSPGHFCSAASIVGDVDECGRAHHAGAQWQLAIPTPITFEIGGNFLRLDGGDVNVQGVAEHDGTAFAFSTSGASEVLAGTAAVRFRVGFERFFYAGGEIDAGAGPHATGTTVDAAPGLQVDVRDVMHLGIAAILGTEVVLGVVGLRAEAVVGASLTASGFGTRAGTCSDAFVISAGNVLVEPRLAIDLWLTPWITLGVSGGADVTGTVNAAQVGLALGFHTRTYDGARP